MSKRILCTITAILIPATVRGVAAGYGAGGGSSNGGRFVLRSSLPLTRAVSLRICFQVNHSLTICSFSVTFLCLLPFIPTRSASVPEHTVYKIFCKEHCTAMAKRYSHTFALSAAVELSTSRFLSRHARPRNTHRCWKDKLRHLVFIFKPNMF